MATFVVSGPEASCVCLRFEAVVCLAVGRKAGRVCDTLIFLFLKKKNHAVKDTRLALLRSPKDTAHTQIKSRNSSSKQRTIFFTARKFFCFCNTAELFKKCF